MESCMPENVQGRNGESRGHIYASKTSQKMHERERERERERDRGLAVKIK